MCACVGVSLCVRFPRLLSFVNTLFSFLLFVFNVAQGYGGGYPVMGGYQGGYGMDQPRGGFEPMGGMPEDQWAAQGSPVAGPNGWCRYRAKETGEFYFHNHRTGVTQWDKPADWNL